MNTMMSILICEHGPLAHGTRSEIEAERDRWIKDLARNGRTADFTIIDFDYRTHGLDNKGYPVERDEPLTIYSAEELYRFEVIRVDPYFRYRGDLGYEIFPEVGDIANIPDVDGLHPLEFRILSETSDYTLATLWFSDKPFMVVQQCGLNYQRYITDEEVYWRCVDYLLDLLRPENLPDLIDPTEKNINLTCFGGYDINLKGSE